MKKWFTVCLVFLLIIFSIFHISGDAAREKIVILNFRAANTKASIADAVTENFVTSFVDLNVFQVIERSQLKKILNELKLAGEDDFDDDMALEVGKLAKAQLVLVGSVTKLGQTYTINARGINVETGSILFGQSMSASREGDLPDTIRELTRTIVFSLIEENEIEDTEELANFKQRNEDSHKKSIDDGSGKKWEYVGSKFFTEITKDALSNKKVHIGNVVPFYKPGIKDSGIEATKHIGNEAKDNVDVRSELYVIDENPKKLQWEYEFKFNKEGKKKNRKEMQAEAGLVFQDIRITKKIAKQGGIYLRMRAKTPGIYALGIWTPQFEVGRHIFINSHTDDYFIPFDSFRSFRDHKKRAGELLSKVKKGKINIYFGKTMHTLLNSIDFKGNTKLGACIIEEAGLFTYQERSDQGAIVNFDTPIDHGRISFEAGTWVEPDIIAWFKAQKAGIFKIHDLSSGIDNEDSHQLNSSYLHVKSHFVVSERINEFPELGFGLELNMLLKPVPRFKAISFLVKGKGVRSLNCSLSSGPPEDIIYTRHVPLNNEWVRVVIPVTEFYGGESKKQDMNIKALRNLTFMVHRHNISPHGRTDDIAGEYFLDLKIDEIKFIR